MSNKNFSICDYCCEWVSDHTGAEPIIVMEDYPKMMCKVLRHEFGLSKRAAKEFVSTAYEDETDVEKEADSELYARAILGDVHYCSDRWSWDRVMRVQWLYRQLIRQCRRDQELAECRPIPDETERWGCFCNEMGECGTYFTLHVMKCPKCGRTYEHVNGDYERCPHCGIRFGTRDN